MTTATFTRPAASVLAGATYAAEGLVHEYGRQAADENDPLGYFLACAAVADHLGLNPGRWIRQARATGATWQQIADALNTTKGNVHGKYHPDRAGDAR